MGFSNAGGVRLGVAQRRQTQPRNRGPMASERCLKVSSIGNRKKPGFSGRVGRASLCKSTANAARSCAWPGPRSPWGPQPPYPPCPPHVFCCKRSAATPSGRPGRSSVHGHHHGQDPWTRQRVPHDDRQGAAGAPRTAPWPSSSAGCDWLQIV